MFHVQVQPSHPDCSEGDQLCRNVGGPPFSVAGVAQSGCIQCLAHCDHHSDSMLFGFGAQLGDVGGGEGNDGGDL
jgi:hypothetical protein